MRSLKRVYSDPWCQQCLNAIVASSVSQPSQPSQEVDTELSDHVFVNPHSPEALVARGKSWHFYFSQLRVWRSSFALSMLHLTVLSFGQIMTVYVLTLGISAVLVAVYRSTGEVMAVIGTTCTPKL